ncbi:MULTISPECIES: tyrosine-protein phosphatase [unclassified Sphingobium]|uniref:tyrosine-protein phosphatase n=1 Tax=unclassified Sphingobium TaxID=2611147 RepID=UPI0035A5FFC4
MLAAERIVRCEGINNFRDFGGWRAADGARVATGRLFRSAHLHRASAADLDRIAGAGITTVADLRHPGERQAQPSAWIGRLPLRAIVAEEGGGTEEAPHILALRASDFGAAAMRRFLADYYETMAYEPQHIAVYTAYFDALADNPGATLIHCAAGKDRTGILAWLTHRLLDVHPDDALEDYLLSNVAGNLADRMPHIRASMERTYGRTISEEGLTVLLSVEPDYLRRCEAGLVATSGSVNAYLADVLDVGPAKAQRIRERLMT